jgi:hypothetical protein
MPADKVNIIGIAQSGETVRHSAWAAERDNNAHWMEVETGLVGLYNGGPVDTMAVFFPAGDGVAAGYLVEGGQPTMFLHWHYASGPFNIHLCNEEEIKQLSSAAGLNTLKSLLDRHAGAPLPGLGTPLGGVRFSLPGGKPGNA